MTKIFISHSSNDTDFARQLAQALTEVGIDVWIDVNSIRAGSRWNDAVQEGLKTCDAMILILTPDSMESPNVGDEWLYYLRRQKPIFTVLWKPTDIHFQLERIQYIKFHEQEFTAAFERLRAELERQGIIVSGAPGEMHEIRSDGATPRSSSEQSEDSGTALPRVEDILPPPFEWVDIPGGSVILDEPPTFGRKGGEFEIPAFRVARYPITNAQYAVFLADKDGYANRKWWNYSDNARIVRQSNLKPRTPENMEDDHPRSAISWYDAVAFCRWLSEKCGLQITLPTEQQWQRAAVGDSGWAYPWGDDYDVTRCNTAKSGNMHTTPVTQYTEGASPFGVVDMVGNVWEWCLNDWNTGKPDIAWGSSHRAVRGGSYAFWGSARATDPGGIDPDSANDAQGFRIVENLT